MPHNDRVHAAADVTDLLVAWGAGDRSAESALLDAVYAELHHQADRAMRREPADLTLQTTGLVHEAYLRLVDQRRVQWRNRSHFFGVSAALMRRILVDHARARLAEKRGGAAAHVSLSGEEPDAASDQGLETLALHDALERLALLDPEQARIVELRYFGGLTIEETADSVGWSLTKVKAEWAIARAWLRREMERA